MTIRTTPLGGTDWVTNEDVTYTDMNDTFDAVSALPLGTILPWAKSFTSVPQTLPSGFVECDGSVLSSASSPINGVTLPDLNNNNRFIRGSSASGGTGGSDSVTLNAHTPYYNSSGWFESDIKDGGFANHGAYDNKPPFYDVVFIIKVKN